MSLININNQIGVAKYKQIVQSVERGLENGILKVGDQLPSINSIRKEFDLSRDTVLLAFNELKLRGIVQSVAGKGYYVKSVNTNVKQKIFLLFDELNSFKEDIYNSFINNLDEHIDVDIFFHHFNIDVFNNLIYDNVGNYNYFIIMPANLRDAHVAIERLPHQKVYILDQTHPELSSYSAIFQNFEHDLYNGLIRLEKSIKNYEHITMVFSDDKQPQGFLLGFERFCSKNNLSYEIIPDLEDHNVSNGEVYLIFEDKSLITLIKQIKANNLKLSKDIGIISYNDTPLKEIIEGGITSISTNFSYMGKRLAKMVTNKESISIKNPSSVIVRNSI